MSAEMGYVLWCRKQAVLAGVYRIGAPFGPDEMPFRIITQGNTIKDVNVKEFFDRSKKQRSKNECLLANLLLFVDSIYILIS